MLTIVFLPFLQCVYSYEIGYAIQHALQLVGKQKYFLEGLAECCVISCEHLRAHS